jgi:serine/threonine protein kinase
MNDTNIIANKYKIIQKIGSGTFGSIFEGINIRTHEKVAIKIEQITDELKLLKNESNIYRLLSNVDGVPKIKWYGKDETYYYMVIDLFGDSLQELLDKSVKLSLKTTLQIGINILSILMKIHDTGFIHRDIKPENFLLTLHKPRKVFLIDFGISKPYIINNKHIEFKIKNKFIGTLNFASINTHNFCEQSRRDDLESLAYMLIYFYLGELEWINKNINEIEIDYDKFETENNYIKDKKNIINEIKDIPNVLKDFYKKTRELSFEERPHYENYMDIFKEEIYDLIELV